MTGCGGPIGMGSPQTRYPARVQRVICFDDAQSSLIASMFEDFALDEQRIGSLVYMVFYCNVEQIFRRMFLLGDMARFLNRFYDCFQVRRRHFLARASRGHGTTALMSKD